ncbi:hypothetical protein H112_07055 [Trichophyton rubrum D6]|uniref:Uncharacterized protein n=3 Tax=Trichophyton TaxID=5550 RepID=A0A080WL85_TRIRC|nr:uncharacterized protein TERG_11841 [Trichophyton rubrum CBS 118892]EZF11827.1 hypothetical protein H100_07077 [Trichophyton rubrum MR850]EZF38722.1 hypothetical protein H102_07040 [Trichophyton rubrum CBS 100081]EZF49355.1 hypothetical protein H103_07061 [Trichophyton rubrum CBS 288.86]EZF59969.1 hypothetical protein H104_07016 [Trichophyton rubrum CBS 289.86]EZF70619.1 hypothetical protein H105_07075 [Trichophyton soudanense CBS 452.61]EZF81284.1 hypothetical protein H110_07057 [Trichophy
MAQKDMRRADLVVPYEAPPIKKTDGDISGTIASTMPMAAMFTRNRMIGWSSLVFTLQTWLAESEDQRKASTTPAYMSVFMSAMAVIVTYMPLFLPPPQAANKAPPAPAS